MKNRTIFRTKILIPGVAMMLSACTGGLQIPDGSGDGVSLPGGQGQGQGIPFPTNQGQGLPMPGQVGSAGSGDIEDLEDVFDDSLGDFDKEIGQEQAGMSSGGMGSTQSAERRETRDASAARGKSGGRKRVGVGVGQSDQSGSQSGSSDGERSGDSSGGEPATSEGGTGGDGSGTQEFEGKTEKAKDGDAKKPAHKIPENVVVNTSTEDQVAEQIREAAEAEEDPLIREALWEEYRRQTGQKNE